MYDTVVLVTILDHDTVVYFKWLTRSNKLVRKLKSFTQDTDLWSFQECMYATTAWKTGRGVKWGGFGARFLSRMLLNYTLSGAHLGTSYYQRGIWFIVLISDSIQKIKSGKSNQKNLESKYSNDY